mgnify:CR=1 FL=1
MKSPPGNLKAIAKEIALELSLAVFRPKTASHIPGIANTVADVLSRKFEPNRRDWKLPQELHGVEEVFPGDRTPDYYMIAHNPREQVGSERL